MHVARSTAQVRSKYSLSWFGGGHAAIPSGRRGRRTNRGGRDVHDGGCTPARAYLLGGPHPERAGGLVKVQEFAWRTRGQSTRSGMDFRT